MNDDERTRVSVHESGHTLVMLSAKLSFDGSITIVPGTHPDLGDYLGLCSITGQYSLGACLGGIIAERIVLDRWPPWWDSHDSSDLVRAAEHDPAMFEREIRRACVALVVHRAALDEITAALLEHDELSATDASIIYMRNLARPGKVGTWDRSRWQPLIDRLHSIRAKASSGSPGERVPGDGVIADRDHATRLAAWWVLGRCTARVRARLSGQRSNPQPG